MPSSDRGIREVTQPVEFAIVDDRMHFTVVSGPCVRTFSISFHKARNAAMVASAMLDRRDREIHGNVRRLAKGGGA